MNTRYGVPEPVVISHGSASRKPGKLRAPTLREAGFQAGPGLTEVTVGLRY